MVDAIKTKYKEIARKIRAIPPEELNSSYEWEELVQKMCISDDDGLHEIGVRELKALQQKCPHCPVFRNS